MAKEETFEVNGENLIKKVKKGLFFIRRLLSFCLTSHNRSRVLY